MNNLRDIGYSNKSHYYQTGDLFSANIGMQITMKEKVCVDALRRAAERLLEAMPEFKVRPVVLNGKYYYEDNTEPAPVFPKQDGKVVALGSDETNGYQFYIAYREKDVFVSIFHGMTDGQGMMMLISALMYYYGVELGFELGECPVPEAHMSDLEMFDPYRYFVGEPQPAAQNAPPERPIFEIPQEWDFSQGLRIFSHVIKVRNDQFGEVVKANQTSYAAMLITMFSEIIAEYYQVKDEDVVAFLPASMRKVFGTQTRMNFSRPIRLSLTPEDFKMTTADRCRKIRSTIKESQNKDYFIAAMSESMASTRRKEAGTTLKNATVINNMTYSLTYPGKMDFPPQYDAFIASNIPVACAPIKGCTIAVYAIKDSLLIEFVEDKPTSPLYDAVLRKFDSLGLTYSVCREGQLFGDKAYSDRLKVISEESKG